MDNLEIMKTRDLPINRPICDILKDAVNIDYKKVANEVLTWTINDVENFIDNQQKSFKIDFVLDNVESMDETRKIQDLYLAIPEDESGKEEQIKEAEQCRRELDKIVLKAYEEIRASKDLLDQLFKRMIFYYEKIIISPEKIEKVKKIDKELKWLALSKENAQTEEKKEEVDSQIRDKIEEGRKLVEYQELKGRVDVLKFEYEAFEVGVQVSKKDISGEKETVKEYVIPEGFTLWIEIAYQSPQRPVSVF